MIAHLDIKRIYQIYFIEVYMESKEFNPKGKEFILKLNDHSCYECKCGNCSLEDLTLEDIKKYEPPICIPPESDKEYCIGIAKLLLQGELKSSLSVSKYSCGHYSIGDGQHRVCAAAHLMDKDVAMELNATIEYEKLKCYYCGMMEKYNNMASSITIFHKIFKTRLFREYTEGINNLNQYNILKKL